MIEIDIEFILKHSITANQFLLFRLILDGSIGTINRLYTNISDLELDIRNLINKRFIQYEYNGGNININEIIPKPTFANLYKNDIWFDEFLALFPTSITRPDGSKDYLKTDLIRSRKAYNKLVGKNKSKHDLILNGLALELQEKMRYGKMGLFKKLFNWITSEEYLGYCQNIEQPIENTEVLYGQQLK